MGFFSFTGKTRNKNPADIKYATCFQPKITTFHFEVFVRYHIRYHPHYTTSHHSILTDPYLHTPIYESAWLQPPICPLICAFVCACMPSCLFACLFRSSMCADSEARATKLVGYIVRCEKCTSTERIRKQL